MGGRIKRVEAVKIDGEWYEATIVHHANCTKCDLDGFCPFPLHCDSMIGHKVFRKNDGKKKKDTSTAGRNA